MTDTIHSPTLDELAEECKRLSKWAAQAPSIYDQVPVQIREAAFMTAIDRLRDMAKAQQWQPVPEGWKLVPVEPTKEMKEAGGKEIDEEGVVVDPDSYATTGVAAVPPMCGYCDKPANLVTGTAIYPHRTDLAHLRFWQCSPCDAYVGCHAAGAHLEGRNGRITSDGTLPKGTLANAKLRRHRQAAHAIFDPIWIKARNKGKARRHAYAWLANALGIPTDRCHIGEFDAMQCEAVVQACKTRTPRHDRPHP